MISESLRIKMEEMAERYCGAYHPENIGHQEFLLEFTAAIELLQKENVEKEISILKEFNDYIAGSSTVMKQAIDKIGQLESRNIQRQAAAKELVEAITKMYSDLNANSDGYLGMGYFYEVTEYIEGYLREPLLKYREAMK